MNPFSEYKFRPSSVYRALTYLNPLTEKQREALKDLKTRREDPKAKPLTQNMIDEMDKLEAKMNDPNLPDGVISYLDEIYDSVIWGRERIVETKQMEKGTLVEQDALSLLSWHDELFYKKNERRYSNEWLSGTPDYVGNVKTIDTKSSWDINSFRNADPEPYKWQIFSYMWLTGCPDGEIAFCLLNNPLHQLVDEINRQWYRWGQPDETNDAWRKMVKQIERNMIYDFSKFAIRYPNHDLMHSIDEYLRWTIPNDLRIRRFEYKWDEMKEDVSKVENRLRKCRNYLINKCECQFLPHLKKITNVQNKSTDDGWAEDILFGE